MKLSRFPCSLFYSSQVSVSMVKHIYLLPVLFLFSSIFVTDVLLQFLKLSVIIHCVGVFAFIYVSLYVLSIVFIVFHVLVMISPFLFSFPIWWHYRWCFIVINSDRPRWHLCYRTVPIFTYFSLYVRNLFSLYSNTSFGIQLLIQGIFQFSWYS